MNTMKSFWIFGFILVAVCLLEAYADPEPEPAKAHRSAYFNEPANPRFRSVPLPVDIDDYAVAEARQADDNAGENVNEENPDNVPVPVKGDASSGRLFMKKFLLFKNIFGANTASQPVIPVIITGAGNTGTATANPTVTITSTGTVPTATGTITTSPVTQRASEEMIEVGEDNESEPQNVQNVDVQALQAALAANANEYVVTDQEIKGTSDSKATKQQQNTNLRLKGGKKGQYITVRIPQKYRRYFKNGQKVMLNTNNGNRNGNRRVIRKRVNKNRRRVNKNNRNRIVNA